MANYEFPTETVDLPSKGHFYFQGHPLSSGKVELKYMTAKEEDILTSQNLIQQGTVIDVLLESLIVDKSIKVEDLLVGDKNALMVAARVLGYGADYEFEYDGEKHTADLSKLEPLDIDFSKCPKGSNEFEFELPTVKKTIKFKLLTGKDEKIIDSELQALKKINSNISKTLTTRLKHMIISVDGETNKSEIVKFIDNQFLSRDSLAFRKYLETITPDMDMTTKNTSADGKETSVVIPITLRFFWPAG